jgi:hypothetical protein
MDRGIRVLLGIGVAVLIILLLVRAGSHGPEGTWIKTDAPLPESERWVNLERVSSILFYRSQGGTETAALDSGITTDARQLKQIHAYLEQRRFR